MVNFIPEYQFTHVIFKLDPFFSEIDEIFKIHEGLGYGKINTKDIEKLFLKKHDPVYIN